MFGKILKSFKSFKLENYHLLKGFRESMKPQPQAAQQWNQVFATSSTLGKSDYLSLLN